MGIEAREARWIVEEFAPGGDSDARDAVISAGQRRLGGEPLQYILGHWPFRHLDLDVDPRVLIPRPETEELVTHALEQLARLDVRAPLIFDLGCGSGAIGLSLLSELDTRGVKGALFAVDISHDALNVTRRNAVKHHLSAVSLVQSNWFDALDSSLRGRVDLIVANPPYISDVDFGSLDPILRFEPHGALVSADVAAGDGFSDLAHIIAEAPGWLSARGTLIIEHGDTQGSVRTEKDLSSRERFLIGAHQS
jgi:release factor glutamine methyltransferase